MSRRALNDYVVPDHPSLVIEKGTAILIPLHGIHRDPEFYPNPDSFNPDNFSAEKMAQRDVVTFLGFGEGPRQCIGTRFGKMQSKLGLARFLQKFKVSVGPKTQVPIKFDLSNSVLVPERGVFLRCDKI